MVSKIFSVIFVSAAVALVGAGATASPDLADSDRSSPDPEPMACPSVTSQRVEKTGGAAAGYPASCKLPTCRIMNSTAQKIAYLPDPFCPLCPSVPTLQWRYQVKLGSVPANACPADVVAGPWKQP